MAFTTLGLLLHPLDVLFFRDSRPFGARDTGHSVLPTPQTYTGMLKTHLMHAAGLKPRDLHGMHRPAGGGGAGFSDHWFGKVRFRGPWPYVLPAANASPGAGKNMEGPLVPVPADLVGQGKSGDGSPQRLAPLRDRPPGWPDREAGLHPLWADLRGRAGPVSGWINKAGLASYLRGGTVDKADIIGAEGLFGWADRTGIAIDPDSHTAEEGAIYSTRLLVLKPGICFYGELDWPEDAPSALGDFFPGSLYLPWGGEGHRVKIERLASAFAWPAAQPVDGRMLSLLITPGIFSNSSTPWKPRERGSLIAAAVPRPMPVSGWDMAGSAESSRAPGPKPTRFAVPAGAVYFWHRSDRKEMPGVSGGPPLVDSLSDRPRDSDAGWGIALCGTWNYYEP